MRKLGSKSLRGRENLSKLASKSLRGRENLRKRGSKSLRGHLVQESSARSHFEVTWLEKTRLKVTSRPRNLNKTWLEVTWLAQNIEKTRGTWARGHLAQENSARGHFEATWLEKTRLEVTSRSRTVEKTRLEVTSRSRKLEQT